MTLLSDHQKRLIYRAGHRGTREMDILLGGFAAQYVPGMDAAALHIFEALLDIQDPDLWDYVVGKTVVPEASKSTVMSQFLDFKLTDKVSV